MKTHAPNARAFVRENLLKLKAHINSHTLIVEDFSPPHSPMDLSPKHKLKREIRELTDVMK